MKKFPFKKFALCFVAVLMCFSLAGGTFLLFDKFLPETEQGHVIVNIDDYDPNATSQVSSQHYNGKWNWDYIATYKYYLSGSGTKNKPWKISDKYDWAFLGERMNALSEAGVASSAMAVAQALSGEDMDMVVASAKARSAGEISATAFSVEDEKPTDPIIQVKKTEAEVSALSAEEKQNPENLFEQHESVVRANWDVYAAADYQNYYELTTNLDLSECDWKPIPYLSGFFNGNNYKINLGERTVELSTTYGYDETFEQFKERFYSDLNASRNLFNYNGYSWGLFTLLGDLEHDSFITNLSVEGKINFENYMCVGDTNTEYFGGALLGGFAANACRVTFQNCTNAVDINYSTYTPTGFTEYGCTIGGFVGRVMPSALGNDSKNYIKWIAFDSCVNVGDIKCSSVTQQSRVGGFVGFFTHSGESNWSSYYEDGFPYVAFIVNNCISWGSINLRDKPTPNSYGDVLGAMGGFFGQLNQTDGVIQDCATYVDLTNSMDDEIYFGGMIGKTIGNGGQEQKTGLQIQYCVNCARFNGKTDQATENSELTGGFIGMMTGLATSGHQQQYLRNEELYYNYYGLQGQKEGWINSSSIPSTMENLKDRNTDADSSHFGLAHLSSDSTDVAEIMLKYLCASITVEAKIVDADKREIKKFNIVENKLYRIGDTSISLNSNSLSGYKFFEVSDSRKVICKSVNVTGGTVKINGLVPRDTKFYEYPNDRTDTLTLVFQQESGTTGPGGEGGGGSGGETDSEKTVQFSVYSTSDGYALAARQQAFFQKESFADVFENGQITLNITHADGSQESKTLTAPKITLKNSDVFKVSFSPKTGYVRAGLLNGTRVNTFDYGNNNYIIDMEGDSKNSNVAYDNDGYGNIKKQIGVFDPMMVENGNPASIFLHPVSSSTIKVHSGMEDVKEYNSDTGTNIKKYNLGEIPVRFLTNLGSKDDSKDKVEQDSPCLVIALYREVYEVTVEFDNNTQTQQKIYLQKRPFESQDSWGHGAEGGLDKDGDTWDDTVVATLKNYGIDVKAFLDSDKGVSLLDLMPDYLQNDGEIWEATVWRRFYGDAREYSDYFVGSRYNARYDLKLQVGLEKDIGYGKGIVRKFQNFSKQTFNSLVENIVASGNQAMANRLKENYAVIGPDFEGGNLLAISEADEELFKKGDKNLAEMPEYAKREIIKYIVQTYKTHYKYDPSTETDFDYEKWLNDFHYGVWVDNIVENSAFGLLVKVTKADDTIQSDEYDVEVLIENSFNTWYDLENFQVGDYGGTVTASIAEVTSEAGDSDAGDVEQPQENAAHKFQVDLEMTAKRGYALSSAQYRSLQGETVAITADEHKNYSFQVVTGDIMTLLMKDSRLSKVIVDALLANKSILEEIKRVAQTDEQVKTAFEEHSSVKIMCKFSLQSYLLTGSIIGLGSVDAVTFENNKPNSINFNGNTGIYYDSPVQLSVSSNQDEFVGFFLLDRVGREFLLSTAPQYSFVWDADIAKDYGVFGKTVQIAARFSETARGGVAPNYVGGVYEITSAQNLVWLSAQVATGGVNVVDRKPVAEHMFRLMNDIDMKDISFVPIGNEKNPFKGVFDGNFKHIKNLKTFASVTPAGSDNIVSNRGLFGNLVGAEIKNLFFDLAQTTGFGNVGVVAGHAIGTTFTRIEIYDNSVLTASAIELYDVYEKKISQYGLVDIDDGKVNFDAATHKAKFVTKPLPFGPRENFGALVGLAESCSFLGCSNRGTINRGITGGDIDFYAGLVGKATNTSFDQCFNVFEISKGQKNSNMLTNDAGSCTFTDCLFGDIDVSMGATLSSLGNGATKGVLGATEVTLNENSSIWGIVNGKLALKIFYWI